MMHNPQTKEDVYNEVVRILGANPNNPTLTQQISVNDDLTVDVKGNVKISNRIWKIGDYDSVRHESQRAINVLPFKFGTIAGDLMISDMPHLASLEGMPNTVTGDVVLIDLPLIKDLEFITQHIGENCTISQCVSLSSIKNLPSKINQDLTLTHLPKITSLIGCSTDVHKIIISLENLISLEHLPKNCNFLAIRKTGRLSLKGIADIVGKITNRIMIRPDNITDGGIGLLLCSSANSSFDAYSSSDSPNDKIEAFDIIKEYFKKPEDLFECQLKLIEAGLERFAEL